MLRKRVIVQRLIQKTDIENLNDVNNGNNILGQQLMKWCQRNQRDLYMIFSWFGRHIYCSYFQERLCGVEGLKKKGVHNAYHDNCEDKRWVHNKFSYKFVSKVNFEPYLFTFDLDVFTKHIQESMPW